MICIFASSALFAALPAVPKEALQTLQITKGTPCRTGVVFMDGKYLSPPYVIKRHGTAITINDVQVTAPLIAWEEFLKTQPTAKVTKTETPQAVPAEQPKAEPEAVEEEEDPLADLFDDDPPKPRKKATPKKAVVQASPKPVVTTTYSMEGAFVMNEAAKALVEKINRYRADIQAQLAAGGFIFFGSNYARVSGEAREAKRLIVALPDIMRTSADAKQLFAALRRSDFFYLTEPIANDLFRNKHRYPQIEARAKKMCENDKLDALIRSSFK